VKMPRIIMPKFWSLQVPLPPPSEQRRIVEILSKGDELRRKRADADDRAPRILASLFYKIFGDPAVNPRSWEFRILGETGATVRYGLGQPPAAAADGIPLIRATNVSAGRILRDDMLYVDPNEIPPGRNAYLRAEEVIVVRTGAYTGDVAQVTKKWEGAVAGYDLVVSPGDLFLGEFIEAYLLTPFIQKGHFANLKARAGQPHLNADQVSETPIPMVPMEKQRHFASCVNLSRAIRDQSERGRERLLSLFDLLLYQAFSGELTRTWREAHMRDLLAEMEQQAKLLNIPKEALLC